MDELTDYDVQQLLIKYERHIGNPDSVMIDRDEQRKIFLALTEVKESRQTLSDTLPI